MANDLQVKNYLKLTTLRLSHNLFQIPRDAIVFKIESLASGPGGKHVYVRHSEVRQFLADHQKGCEDPVFPKTLHVTFSQSSPCVLDIDVKSDQYEESVWKRV